MAALEFSIDTFSQKMHSGGALGSLFQCNLVTGPGGAAGLDDFKFLCKGATLPGSAIEAATVTYMGRAMQIPGNRAAAQLTTSVYNDEYMEIRNYIETWMEGLNSHRTNKRSSDMVGFESYTGSLTVEQLSKTGGLVTKGYEFVQAWPSSTTEIAVAWDTNDIETFDIVWEYAYWKSAESAVGTD